MKNYEKKVSLDDYLDVTDYINWGDISLILTKLKEFKYFDVLYDEGRFFSLAIEKNYCEIVKSLIQYFETKQFPIKNNEYSEAKEKLKEILEDATDSIETSAEMKQVLSPYLDFEGDLDNRLQEFSEQENSEYQSWISSLQVDNDVSETSISKKTEPIYPIQDVLKPSTSSTEDEAQLIGVDHYANTELLDVSESNGMDLPYVQNR